MSVTVTDCLFCRIVAGEIPADKVHETDTVVAFRDITPRAKVHSLVIPKEHHESLAELATAAPGLVADVFAAAGEVAAKEGVAQTGYRLVSNVGEDGGQEVAHVHVHVLGAQSMGPVGVREQD
ncbi:histidine triad (HIT) family protein [Ornithinicoccus hortensis]|uniref:Histidine triad (HIT) family protein n=1 Tax=Ornithinicoccus hortensis TaxID=82346 RepID=A0A542YSF3_9MICO|nr:histidine triad (HIT) family protein [Ornithinicoccus hortensis]